MYEELVKRLRARAKREDDYYEHGGDVINEAADAIEELQEQVLEWQKSRDLERSLCAALEYGLGRSDQIEAIKSNAPTIIPADKEADNG